MRACLAALCLAVAGSAERVGREGVVQGGALDATYLWEGCDVPYVVASNEHMKEGDARLVRAIQMWRDELPGLRFRKAESTDTSYMKFIGTSGGGGSSPLGRQVNMPNSIYIGADCGLGCTAHEIGHSLGLNHEQCRSDRDAYVTVVKDNISKGMGHNFHKYSLTEGQDVLPYDYDSLMHYEPKAWSKDHKGRTILSPHRIGQRYKPSKRDGEAIRFIYNNCQKPAAPKCVASVETGTRIAHRKYFQVTFVAISGAPVGVAGISALSARGTGGLQVGLPEGAYLKPSTHGGNGHYHSSGVVQWVPPHTTSETRHRLAVRFEDAQQRAATCEVEVVVVPTRAVCFGKAAEDPNVCGGNGQCTDVPHAPCKCNNGRAGAECKGYAYCTQNYDFDFEDDSAFMEAMPWRWGASFTTARARSGKRSLEVRGQTGLEPWDTQYRPTRVRFTAAAPRREGALKATMYSPKTGTCLNMEYDHASGEIRSNYKVVLQSMEHLRWYAFDLVLDWSAKTVRWIVDGQQVLQTELGCDYMEVIRFDTSPVHNKRIGAQDTPLYLDDVAFECSGPGVPPPSPVRSTPTPPHVTLPQPTPIPVSPEHHCQGRYRAVYGPQPGSLSYGGDASGLVCWRMECTGGHLYLKWTGVSLRSRLYVTDADGKETVTSSGAPGSEWLHASVMVRLESASGSTFKVSWECSSYKGPAPGPTPAPAPAPVPVPTPVPATVPPTGECKDLTLPNGQPWHELGNVGYDCKYYTDRAGACAEYGGNYRNTHTGNEACCACGGGSTGRTPQPAPTRAPAPAPTPAPAPAPSTPAPGQCTDLAQPDGKPWHHKSSDYYSCAWYASDKTYCKRFGAHYRNTHVANEACCVCGGGSGGQTPPPPGQCKDRTLSRGQKWHHRNNDYYNCEWYGSVKTYCSQFGSRYRNENLAAVDACCVCGGGDK